MKDLLECLMSELGEAIAEVMVGSVRVGLVYTGVMLSTGDAGVAYTPMHELSYCPVLAEAGEIAGKPASEVMKKAESHARDHHFLRDMRWKERIVRVFEEARKKGIKVRTAAEFAGKPVEMLEAHRKELYQKFPSE